MAWPTSLQTGLKEWAAVCGALGSGRQIVLLRKGGIHESAGEFELEHREFLLFPTYLHQSPGLLKPEAAGQVQAVEKDPDEVELSVAGQVTDIVQIQSRGQLEGIDALHVWTEGLIDLRLGYRPENPLYLLLVRAFRLPEVVTVVNTPAYAGCKSWVPLSHPIGIGGATPVLDEARWAHQRQRVMEGLGVGARV